MNKYLEAFNTCIKLSLSIIKLSPNGIQCIVIVNEYVTQHMNESYVPQWYTLIACAMHSFNRRRCMQHTNKLHL